MEEISFSIFDRGQIALAKMQDVLSTFEKQERLHINLDVISWETGWQKLVEFALYHHGPDISEIGSTWIMDLVRMVELRQFSLPEATRIEGNDKFFDAVWISGRIVDVGGLVIWAIPWSADPRVVFYRRDLLKKAGLDEVNAFGNAASFDETIHRLQASGVEMPLALPTSRSRRTIHNLASWVWESGGDFLSSDQQDITFDLRNAIQGIKSYFRLGRYLNREAHSYDDSQADRAFWSGKSAVTISGHWILDESQMPAGIRENLGIVPVLRSPFVGGSHLVIWKHSPRPEAALRLLNFLINDPIAEDLHPYFGLPVRESRWNNPPFDVEPNILLAAAIKKGRAFPIGQLWGLVEKRLVDILPEIWNAVLDKSENEIDSIVQTKMDIVAQRLRMAIKG
jgi:ABC-type glycerol-3-phosphate transport system substrate-binding protein